MRRVLYEKIDGEFVPVQEHDPIVMDALPNGHHLISVRPGITSYRRQVDPDYVRLLAATSILEDRLSEMIVNASRAKPSKMPLTIEQITAWESLIDAFGEEIHLVSPSPASIARVITSQLIEEAAGITDDETVNYIKSMMEIFRDK